MLARPATFPKVWFDSNASAPIHPAVTRALHPLLGAAGHELTCGSSFFSNPSSSHSGGRQARKLLDDARTKVARALGARLEAQVIFTSSGSEANQLAIRSVLEPRFLAGEKPHWVVSPVEHDSVLR